MKIDEFQAYMRLQLNEINQYLTINNCCPTEKSLMVFKWIENYAEDFRTKWNYQKYIERVETVIENTGANYD